MKSPNSPNTPYVPELHRHLLVAAAPSFRQVPANAFGDSGSNANWYECDVRTREAAALDQKCEELGIFAGIDTGYPGRSCRKLCRYVRDLATPRKAA
jgi:hypothetical protein